MPFSFTLIGYLLGNRWWLCTTCQSIAQFPFVVQPLQLICPSIHTFPSISLIINETIEKRFKKDNRKKYASIL